MLAVHSISACGSLFADCSSKFEAFVAGTTSHWSSRLCRRLVVLFARWNFSAARALSAMMNTRTNRQAKDKLQREECPKNYKETAVQKKRQSDESSAIHSSFNHARIEL